MDKIDLLLVDDDSAFRKLFRKTFSQSAINVIEAENAEKALKLLEERKFSVAVVDVIMPGMDGMEFLRKIKKEKIKTEVIILSGQGKISDATEAIKLGAFDYLQKPFSLYELESKIINACQKSQFETSEKEKKSGYHVPQSRKPEIIGNSPKIAAIRDMVDKIADSDSSVIIEGESGTGKDVLANVIHQRSGRKDGPFIAINCGALPENLLENELFGHEKGAFTDATAQKRGLFEVAGGGTLFIDEIGEMSSALQVKFLRVLETREFRRLGGTDLIKTNVRIIAATNKNLSEAIKEGSFRKDLYYRLNVFSIHMPALRERWEDIPILVEYFLRGVRASKISSVRKTVDFDAMQKLVSYSWPGNIRELFNVLERALVLSSGEVITKNALPIAVVQDDRHPKNLLAPEMKSLKEMEKEHIQNILREFNYNRNKAAKALGITRQRLYRKIEEYQIETETAS